MKGVANHIELHVANPDATIPFYKDMLGYLEWSPVAEWPGGLGMSDGNISLWLFTTPDGHRQQSFDRDSTGIGHLGFRVDSQADVDEFASQYMTPHSIAPQFETPRARTDFSPNYYQVMFVDPEGLAIEVFCS
jgi:catechol 2,3-dioxygenase-like lactoylglutathione lyase family enzyme